MPFRDKEESIEEVVALGAGSELWSALSAGWSSVRETLIGAATFCAGRTVYSDMLGVVFVLDGGFSVV